MIAHDAPGKNFHVPILLAIIETIQKYFLVFFPRKYIHPINHGKADKVDTVWIMKLIIPAHPLR